MKLKSTLCTWRALVAAVAIATALNVQALPVYYGTTEPMAERAIYFVLTDRFVNGDPANDQREQGAPSHKTFDRPISGPAGETDNIGYLGGDFKGVLDNADYIRDMGFGAVWISPIVDNPDQAFTGGDPVLWGSRFTDRGKTGYHGYWGVNFYRVDEHWPSQGLDFAEFTRQMKAHGLLTVLDIVANHGSPAFTMPKEQPQYGKIYGRDGELLADHQNLPPEQLDPAHRPLHRFFHTERELMQLPNIDDTRPEALDYFIGAYLQWIDQGAAAFRIDTIRHVPHAFWAQFAQRIRARHPGFFMFGEAFDYEAKNIAPHTWNKNGPISVLDFPLKEKLAEVFENPDSDYRELASALYLTSGPYQNPYDLVTFYDNHDMARLNASDYGFIDAHNWLFTARGIPAIYYGSEAGFMRGRAEHAGNRNYFGQARVNAAADHPIRLHLKRIASLRARLPALQKGLQINLQLRGDRAAFYRVYQDDATQQIALVLLNKGAKPAQFQIRNGLQPGHWRAALGDADVEIGTGDALRAEIPAHDVRVFVLDAPVSSPMLRRWLDKAMRRKSAAPQSVLAVAR